MRYIGKLYERVKERYRESRGKKDIAKKREIETERDRKKQKERERKRKNSET